MNREGSHGGISAIMKKHGIRPQKKYGQNFLKDENILKDIVSAAGIGKEDLALEIGPGLGSLTKYLCEAAGEVIAVEIDNKLIPVLDDTLRDYDNVSIVNKDILKTDIRELTAGKNGYKEIKAVANLPYYITTPIIMGLLERKEPLSSITVMIQKEVADRIMSLPGKKTYGALTLAVNYYTEAKVVMEVPPSAFIPNPKVSSAVVHMVVRKEPIVKVSDEKLLFSLIRASFNQRRKTLINGLKNDPKLNPTQEELISAVERLGKPLTVRGEQLSLEEFARLSELVKGNGG